MVQTLPQKLLLSGGQALKRGIVPQSAILFGRRHVFVMAQPVARMSLRPRRRMLNLRMGLGMKRRGMVGGSGMISRGVLLRRSASLRRKRTG